MGLWRNKIFRLSVVILLLGLFFAGTLGILDLIAGVTKIGNAQIIHTQVGGPQAIAAQTAVARTAQTSAAQANAQTNDPQTNESQTETKRKVVLVIINGTTLEDFTPDNTPKIMDIMQKGGVALMNTRSAGSRNTPNSYATIGAGKPVVSSSFAGDAFNTRSTLDEADEISADISYIARTGIQPPPEGVVTLGISQINIANENEQIPDGPGKLGDSLRAAGLTAAVLGNGDVIDDFNRDAVTIAMDKWGRVEYGNVSRNLLSVVPSSALHFQTDYDTLLKEFGKYYGKADFIVVETGDTFRVEELSNTTFPEIMAGERRGALARADAFVGELIKSVDLDNTLVIIASPFPSKQGINSSNFMTPLVLYTGNQETGFLTSGTTRREGIVANSDIAPTVLSYLGVPVPPGMIGRVLTSVPGDNVVDTLAQMNNEMMFVYKARPVLVKGYVGMQIIVMVVIIAIMILWPRFLRYLRPLLLWLMAVPLSLLIIAAVRFVSLPVYTVIAIAVAALVVVGAYRLWGKRDVDLFIIIGLATVLAVILDAFTGSALIKNSTLGYDAMSGARYYGIGNEFMGVIIGAEIIAVAGLWEKYHRKHRRTLEIFTIAFFLITTLILGAPQLGSNVGGTIAATGAFAFTYMRLKGIKIRFRQLAAVGTGVALVIVCLAVIDMNRSVEVQSHLGRLASSVRTGGWMVFWDMAVRKVNMNIKLMRYTIWSKVFLVMLAALMVSFYRPVGLMEKVREHSPYIFQGLLGILVGSAIALAVNDSGIVAAATMMIFGMAPLIYLMGREREHDVDCMKKPHRA